MRALHRGVALAVCAALVTGCAGCTSSTVTAQPTTALPTAPLFSDPATVIPTVVLPAASASAVTDLGALGRARTAAWPTIRDTTSGASFRLPRTVRPTSRTTNGIVQQLYTVQVTPTTGVSIAFSRAGSAANVQDLLVGYLDTVAQQFQDEGVTDARILDKTALKVGAYPAMTGRIFFTPKKAPAIPVVWFVEAVAYGRYLVVAQTVTFPLTRSPAYLPAARALQARLAAGLRLS